MPSPPWHCEDGMSRAGSTVSVHPLAGRPGYSLCGSEHHRAPREEEGYPRREETSSRLPRQCADRLLFVEWRRPLPLHSTRSWRKARRLPTTRSSIAAARLPVSSPPMTRRTRPAHAPFDPARPAARRAASSCQSRQGRIHLRLDSRTVVQAGDDLRTRSVVADLTPRARMGEAWPVRASRFQRFIRQRAGRYRAARPADGRLDEANGRRRAARQLDRRRGSARKLVEYSTRNDRGAITPSSPRRRRQGPDAPSRFG